MTGTFEGVGTLQFSPDNKFAYAYSGVIGVTNIEKTLLEFKTESEYIVAKFGIGSVRAEGDDHNWKIYFNEIQINGRYLDRTYNEGYDMDIRTPIIIPPFTTVKVTLDNQSSATEREWMAVVTGEVKGAIEQENLEAITDNNNWASK